MHPKNTTPADVLRRLLVRLRDEDGLTRSAILRKTRLRAAGLNAALEALAATGEVEEVYRAGQVVAYRATPRLRQENPRSRPQQPAHRSRPARPLEEGLLITPPVSAQDPTGVDRLRRRLIKGGRAGYTRSELQRSTSLRAADLDYALGVLRRRDELEELHYASSPVAYRATRHTLNRPIKRPGRPPKSAAVPANPTPPPPPSPEPEQPARHDHGQYNQDGPCRQDRTAERNWHREVGIALAENQSLIRQCGTEGCTNPDHHMLHTVYLGKERVW